jgi:Spy/CpxP family protein refolding chaperone
MIIRNKYRSLLWIIAILVATNLSMGISFLYHKKQDKILMEQIDAENIEAPTQQRTRFFRDQLDLQPDQVEQFRNLNRNYNRTAWQITNQLERLRIDMIRELGKNTIDSDKLNMITLEIGNLHTRLKNETINYYLAMKVICTEQQQVRLNELFISVIHRDENVRLPQRGRQFRGNWQRDSLTNDDD